eukprot:m.8590 g.8590  ORF g.8590 m.8590 type:complete len:455 (+) comp20723_c0_seq1:265-1629(+)
MPVINSTTLPNILDHDAGFPVQAVIIGVVVGIAAAFILLLCICLTRKYGKRKSKKLKRAESIRHSPMSAKLPVRKVAINQTSFPFPPRDRFWSASGSLPRYFSRHNPLIADSPKESPIESRQKNGSQTPSGEVRNRKISRSVPSSPVLGVQRRLQPSPGMTYLQKSVTGSPVEGDRQRPQRGNGAVRIKLAYSNSDQCLTVTVVNATGLADIPGGCNSYVKLYLADDSTHYKKKKTTVMKNSREPAFHQEFQFTAATFKDLLAKDLLVQVVHHKGPFSKKEALGEARLHLFRVQGEILGQKNFWVNLERNWQMDESRGELDVTLGFHRAGLTLSVIVNKGKNIPDVKSNVYVKVSALHYRHPIADKRKTKRINCTTHPVFNEKFTFDISSYSLDDLLVLCELKQHSKVGPSNKVIGSTVLGCRAPTAHERQHWEEVILNPGKLICRSHQLRKGK